MKPFAQRLTNYWRAGYSMLWIPTHEETRVLAEVNRVMHSNDQTQYKPVVHHWDVVDGVATQVWKKVDGVDTVVSQKVADTAQLPKFFTWLTKLVTEEKVQMIVMKDFHPYFQDPAVVRRFRNLIPLLKTSRNMLVFVSPTIKIPMELEKEIQVLDYALPDREYMGDKLESIRTSANQHRKGKKQPEFEIQPTVKQTAVEAAAGLTSDEAENAFALGLIQTGSFGVEFPTTVFDEKVTQVRKSGLLTYIEPNISFDDIGGLNGLKKWLRVRSKAYSQGARDYGLPYPKGVLLCGVPGGGKTMLAKATAKELGFPLFQLDVGSLFGKLIGE